MSSQKDNILDYPFLLIFSWVYLCFLSTAVIAYYLPADWPQALRTTFGFVGGGVMSALLMVEYVRLDCWLESLNSSHSDDRFWADEPPRTSEDERYEQYMRGSAHARYGTYDNSSNSLDYDAGYRDGSQ